ncbi:MAG: GntR family transcriptional regulator [Lachnospiraceae bacterium]
MLRINYRDVRPIYEQVRDALREQIITGEIEPDEKIPSVREMAAKLVINPNTIQRAYRELESAGYIYSVKGKGSFACGDARLVSKRRDELLLQMKEIALELEHIDTPKEQLIQVVNDIYKEA